MLIVYDSMTGNVDKFVKKLQMKYIKIHNELVVDEDFVLVTYTTGFGEIPKSVSDFLTKNHQHLRGVASSGNKNWKENFGLSADKIAKAYSVPIILKFELSGNQGDIIMFREKVASLETH